MALKSQKNIEINEIKEKNLFNKEPNLLLPTVFIKVLKLTLSQLPQRNATDFLIYKIGEELGKEYFKNFKIFLAKEKINEALENQIKKSCNALFIEGNLGKLEFKKLDLKNNVLEIKITYDPLNNFLNEQYNLERGIIAGIYQEATKEKVYCHLLKKDKHFALLTISFQPLEKNESFFINEKETNEEELNDQPEEKIKILSKKVEELNKKVEKEQVLRIREKAKILDVEKRIKEKVDELEKSRIALINILEDIEEARKKAEKERETVQAIINNFSDGLLLFNNENKLSLINPQAEIILNIKSEEIVDKPIAKLITKDFLKTFFELVGMDLIERKIEAVFRKEIQLKENLILEITTVPIMGNDTTIGTLIILHDVTREKLVERMKTEFVSIAAHQLRTPLSAIKWILRMILDGDLGEINASQREFLEKTYVSNERMISLINDLLNVTRIEEGKYIYKTALTSLENVVESVIESRKDIIERKKINFRFEKPIVPLPLVSIDVEKITLAIQNLLDNAVNYTPENGSIIILLSASEKEVQFSIRDTGIGIPKEEHHRVFSKFFRSSNAMKTETSGSGLGVFIAKNIIEAHGGKIWFESEENKGTTFYFYLPIPNH